jgi:ComF family protein
MELADSILSLIFPQQCAVCSGPVESRSDGCACAGCWGATTVFTGREMLCEKCGAYFGPQAAPVAVRCHKCDDHHYDRAFAAGIYEKAVSASVLRLKTSPALARRLRSVIRFAMSRPLPHADLVVPVPLSKRRRAERGFNQAELVADELSKIMNVAVDRHSLVRRLHTPIHRVGMDQRARELTVENAFAVVRPNLIEGRSVLLVDDVFTSGATASNCAKVLKRNGAGDVNIFTIARAVLH